MEAAEKAERRAWYPLVLSFVVLSVGIVVGGTLYYRHYERQFRAGIEQQLSAVAELKAGELVQYRKERLRDAADFFNNAAFSGLARRFLDHPEDAETQEQLRAWLGKYQIDYQYDRVFLMDTRGVERMSIPNTAAPVSAVVAGRVAEVLQSRQIAFQDFHRNEHDGKIYLTLLVPVFDGPDHNRDLGVLALRIDPATHLYPFISRWPTPSRTAETLLVRREGNDVLFLNELKFRTNTALNLRISLANTNVAAVKAVLGQKEIVECMDYREVPVLAALQAIPDSPWFLVARIDIAEVYAPLRERLWLTVLLVGVLLLGLGAGAGVIRRHQRVQFYKEQSKIAEALRESEERFRRVFEEGPIGMAMLDEAFRFIQVNPAFAFMLGHSMAELRKMTFPDITHPDHVQKDAEQMGRLLRGEFPMYRTEKRCVTRSGKELWGLVHVSVVRNAAGEFRYFLAIINDITERKRAEDELRRTNTFLDSVIENLPNMMFLKEAKTLRFVRFNRAGENLLGCTKNDVLGKTDYDFFPKKELADFFTEKDRQVLRGKEVVDIPEEPLQTRNHGERILHTRKVPILNADGEPEYLLGISEDITERKRAQEALRESQALYHSLVEQLPVGVFRKDRDGRYVFINPWFCRLKGMPAEEFLGKLPGEVAGSEAAKKDPTGRAVKYAAVGGDHHGQIMQTGKPIELDEDYTNADGRKHFVHAIKIPVIDPDGKVIGTQGILFDVTELKLAVEVARQSEERLLKVLTQTRCILNFGLVEGPAGWREHALNPDTPFRWDFPVQNEEAAQKVVPLELAPGERYQQAWTRSRNRADHVQMNWNSGNALLNDLPFYRNEFRCLDKDGVGHWMQQFVTVQKLAENRWQVFGITTDISDLKRIEAELRESQALYYSLVDQMPAGIFRKDPKGHYVFVNSTFCRLKDMTSDQFLGKTALELELTDDALKTTGADHHTTIMQSGKPITVDEVYSRADGETRNYHVVKSPVFDSAGHIVGTQGILFDITDRKRAEEALHLGETRLHVILESTADGILAVDSKGKIITANRRFAELWHIPPSVMDAGDNRALLDFAVKQLSDPDSFLKKVQLLSNSDGVDMDLLVFKDGRIFERHSFPMMMQGAIIGRVWSYRDITERKRQEKELSEKNSELERFTYTVSHDLKSPLVTVKTFLGFLEQDLARPDLERVKQDVTYMRTAADKMGQLLDELLNLARVGRKENPTVRVTFQELVRETVGLIAGRISASGVEVKVADAAVILEGDRPRLLEIWQNLVENACKFMGNQPRPQIEIGVEQRGLETVFFVRDNGSGIEPRFQAKVFGLFEKLDPKGEGTGMGLALVKRIVELYEGRIWVESAGAGRGANFLFTLPGAVILEPKKPS